MQLPPSPGGECFPNGGASATHFDAQRAFPNTLKAHTTAHWPGSVLNSHPIISPADSTWIMARPARQNHRNTEATAPFPTSHCPGDCHFSQGWVQQSSPNCGNLHTSMASIILLPPPLLATYMPGHTPNSWVTMCNTTQMPGTRSIRLGPVSSLGTWPAATHFTGWTGKCKHTRMHLFPTKVSPKQHHTHHPCGCCV